jgi:hypothetical protein
MEQRIASCACGAVRFALSGPPILAAICYCDDCQAGAAQLEALGAAPDFHDARGGTPYVTVRDDRLALLDGGDRLKGVKLRDDAPTTRFIATCCDTPTHLKHAPGWWTSVYAGRLGVDAPPMAMRSQVRHARGDAPLPTDLPTYQGFAPGLIFRLIGARIAMWLAPAR